VKGEGDISQIVCRIESSDFDHFFGCFRDCDGETTESRLASSRDDQGAGSFGSQCDRVAAGGGFFAGESGTENYRSSRADLSEDKLSFRRRDELREEFFGFDFGERGGG
jgi:hypothetical protein